jgi:glutathione S-transferase
MVKWLSLEEGLAAAGLRIALGRGGVPSPWSEFCRGLFHVKGIPFARVQGRDADGGFAGLKAVTAQESLPVVFWESERPRSSWLEQLTLAERLSPAPAGLLPDSPHERALIVGLLSELCAEGGFGWHRRILMIERLLTDEGYGPRERAIGQYLAAKYGYAHASAKESRRRCEAIVAAFSMQLGDGRAFLAGNVFTALDIGWAAFAALLRPLPHEHCPMDALWRDLFTWTPADTSAEAVDVLLAHRDRVYRDWLGLPVVVR